MRKLLIVIIILLLLVPSVVSVSINKSSQSKNGNTLYVGGSGEGNYTKIQDAIDNASEGDTVFVFSGIYIENIIVDTAISLIGENKNTTAIDGNYSGRAIIKFKADGISISGFSIQNSGVSVSYSVGVGIIINSNGNHIFDNIITNTWLGIELEYCSNNTIWENRIVNNGYGFIIRDGSGTNNLISRNFIAHNRRSGIQDGDRDGGTIATWNVIADNGKLDISYRWDGVWTHDSYSVYHHNDFFFNRVNAEVDGGRNGNEWDDGSEGNYWDDWESNPGYPDTYIIPSQFSDEIDHYPNPTPYSNSFIVGQSEGHYYALIDEPIDFIADTSVDPHSVSWFWEFGDGYTSNEINPTHSYNSTGLYHINVTINDNQGRSDTSKSEAQIGRAPNTPAITGPTMGTIGVLYNYTIVATDPDGDDVYYDIGWGDSYYYEDMGPYASGEDAIFNYSWEYEGSYWIRVKAKDASGLESEWTYLKVVMPRNKESSYSLFLQFLERFPLLKQLFSIYFN